jgi:hypothetical protein
MAARNYPAFRWIIEKRAMNRAQRKTAVFARWLHIYLSMASFAIVFFFAVTGLTLNHADRFGGQMLTKQRTGSVRAIWVDQQDTAKVARDEIVRFFGDSMRLRGALSDFRIDDSQVGVSFKGPGYAADIFIDRSTGKFELNETNAGFVGLINDLHKGRDTGHGWSIFIDVCALLLVLVSLTGFLLLLFLKKRRLSGLAVAVCGLFVAWLVYRIWIK